MAPRVLKVPKSPIPAFSRAVLMAVCAIKYTEREDERNIAQIIPVAGTYPSSGIEATTTLLSGASEPEGVRVELHGQTYLDQRQSAIIELTCDNTVDVRPPFQCWLLFFCF
jgi:hypothetical protein